MSTNPLFFCSKCGRDINSYTIIDNKMYCKECWTEHVTCTVCGVKSEAYDVTFYNNELHCSHGGSKPTPIGIPQYNTFMYQRPETSCYKCNKLFDENNPAVPASGCSSSTFVHGSCAQGCNDGGPHQWEVVSRSSWFRDNYSRCKVCGHTTNQLPPP